MTARAVRPAQPGLSDVNDLGKNLRNDVASGLALARIRQQKAVVEKLVKDGHFDQDALMQFAGDICAVLSATPNDHRRQ